MIMAWDITSLDRRDVVIEEERRRRIRAYLAPYSGHAYEVHSLPASDTPVLKHIVDAAFLTAWVEEMIARWVANQQR